jgi:hypothetical protein
MFINNPQPTAANNKQHRTQQKKKKTLGFFRLDQPITDCPETTKKMHVRPQMFVVAPEPGSGGMML